MTAVSNKVLLATTAVALLIALAALAASLAPKEPSIPPTTREVFMAAIEPKGTANATKEPFPTKTLPAGGGYELIPVNEKGEWVIETYRFLPGTIVVNQGDQVSIQLLGVNGKEHIIFIDDYWEKDSILKRGDLLVINFTADKPGVFRVICKSHPPAMTGQLIVLPRA